MTRATLARGAAAIAICLVVVGLLTTPVSAGHSSGVYTFEPDEGGVSPGETIAVDVVFSADRTPAGEGISEMGFTVDYDADRFSVVDVEHGSWFEDGDEAADAEIRRSSSVDEGAGNVSVETALESPGDGIANSAPVATITFRADEDAGDGVSDLAFASSSAAVPSGPQPTIEREAELEVGGDATGIGPMSGFGATAALGSFLLAALVGLRRRNVFRE